MKKIRKVAIAWAILVLFCPSLLYADNSTQVLGTTATVYDPRGPNLQIIAVPEKRIPNVAPDRVENKSSQLILKIYQVGAERIDANVIFSTTTNSDDSARWFDILQTVPSGSYDITIKGYSHLVRLASNIHLDKFIQVDFTNNGQTPLFCGDINLDSGDNKVNALDISILVNNFSTNNLRSDLNQDGVVNSIDISNLLTNFNLVGD